MTHKPTQIFCKDHSLTIQSFLDSTLVENIQKRYQETGLWSDRPLPAANPIMDDMSGLDDFMKLQQARLKAQASFDALPENIKQLMDYNPQRLVEYLDNPANDDESVRLGLRVKKPLETTTELKETPAEANAEEEHNA